MISRQSIVALQHRNFRLIWIGLLVSVTGSMMQNAALLWHVSLLVPPEKKALALGLVGLVNVVPIVVFSMISGVVADAWDRRKLMLVTQLGAALVSVMLAVLTFRGLAVVWPIYLLAGLGHGHRRVRCARPAGAGADAGAPRAPAERHYLAHDHVSDGIGPRPRARWSGDCRRRRRLGVRGQCGFVRMRDRRAVDDARCARQAALAGWFT